MKFQPDRAFFASGSADGTIKLWDFQSCSLKQTLEAHFVLSLAFSDDGTTLISGGADKSVKMWIGPDWKQDKTEQNENFFKVPQDKTFHSCSMHMSNEISEDYERIFEF